MVFFKGESTHVYDSWTMAIHADSFSETAIAADRYLRMFYTDRDGNHFMTIPGKESGKILCRSFANRNDAVGEMEKKTIPLSLSPCFDIKADGAGISKNDRLSPAVQYFREHCVFQCVTGVRLYHVR